MFKTCEECEIESRNHINHGENCGPKIWKTLGSECVVGSGGGDGGVRT